jgi:heme ABC exporter ATP-binding subunit CcmA
MSKDRDLFRLKDVSVTVGHRRLFTVTEWSVARGEVCALIGPNGTGKTTLLRILAGLSRSASGEVEWPSGPEEVHRGVQVLFLASTPALLLDQTVYQNLEFMCNCYGLLPSFAELDAALEHVGLTRRGAQRVRSLSTGQKRRLTFAGLWLTRPDVLFADEPTNGLDASGRKLCHDLLADLSRAGMGCLVATHDLELLRTCNRVLDLEKCVAEQAAARSGTPILELL